MVQKLREYTKTKILNKKIRALIRRLSYAVEYDVITPYESETEDTKILSAGTKINFGCSFRISSDLQCIGYAQDGARDKTAA